MNAIPPKGQMPARKSPAEDDHVHLTIGFEDEDPAEGAGQPATAEPPAPREPDAAAEGTPQARQSPEPAADRPKSGGDRRARDRAGPPPILPQFADIELSLTVEVGSLAIALRDLLSVEPGQLLALDRMTSEPVSVLVNGKPFARGEIVAVGDRYGVRLLEIVSAERGAV